jgi:hypothetical protein
MQISTALFHWHLLSAVTLLACGGSQRAPANAGNDAAEPDTGSAQATSIESQRVPFIQACMGRAPVAAYCDCAFDQFRLVFAGADLAEPIAEHDPRLKALRTKTVTACASTLDEDQVRANFLRGCIEGEPLKRAYCECAWPALRKNLPLADFLGDAETLRFFAAKKQMVVTCKGTFPIELAKQSFMSGCEQEASGDKSCACLWAKVSARFAAEEIAAGTADLRAVPELAECK